jgi:release factor glutamine methyltransferase
VSSSLAGKTIEDARRTLTAELQTFAIDTPELDARLLLGAVLRLDLTGMIAAATRCLTAFEAARLNSLIQRRIGGEPVARLLGVKEFWGLQLQLSPATLVPRPDTETVVEAALDIVRADANGNHAHRIADLGTGSGAILLALLHELPHAIGIGTDISLMALQTARANAAKLGLAARSSFAAGDFAAALAGPFDLIVSNPPYIRTADIYTLAAEVREHDPHRALDGGDDGFDAYRRILNQVAPLLAPGGTLILEVGQHQSGGVSDLAHAAGLMPYGPPRADLAGVLRAVAFRQLPR